jgi:hypothetical protein
MKLFCFASTNLNNIEIGIRNKMWAVSSSNNDRTQLARTTKAKKYMDVGDVGLLYCSAAGVFTTPFIVKSHPDYNIVVENLWPGNWSMPFKIEPLGGLSRQISKSEAVHRWPFVQSRVMRNHGRIGIAAAMNITGTTVFVPILISEHDWNIILSDLAL